MILATKLDVYEQRFSVHTFREPQKCDVLVEITKEEKKDAEADTITAIT